MSNGFLPSASKAMLIAGLAISMRVEARSLIVAGDARLTDGEPVSVGTIYLQELLPREGAMPASRMLTLGTTGRDGKFEFEVDGIDGDLFVKLIADHCSWLGAQKLVTKKELGTQARIEIMLSTERDVCEKPSRQ